MENKRIENQLKAIRERIKVITEAVQNPLESIQEKLEPVQEHLSQLLPRLQQAAILLQNRIDEAELEYKEIADFYQDWKGKTPPRFKRFLDWFFEMNDDKSLGELLEHPFEIKEEDLEQAGLWLLNKIEFEGVKTKLEKLGLSPEDIEYLETVNNTIDAVPMSVKSPAQAKEYVKGITSQMEGFSDEAQAVILEDIARYFKQLPEGQVWLKPSVWIRNAIKEYLSNLQTVERHYCTSKEFRQDISELCPDCPLPKKIGEALEMQILAAVQEMQMLLPTEKFKRYVEAEIDDAVKAMQKMRIQAQAPGALLDKVTEVFIWNKERIKVLRGFLDEQPVSSLEPAPQVTGPEPADEQPVSSQKPTTKVWALYYWYKREANLHPELHSTGKKKKSLEAMAQQHEISPQNLYQTFNAIGRNSDKNPKRNLANIEKVIPLLADFPEAQQLAKDELERKK